MPMHPILSALKRHKAGTILIVLQVGFTLAIVCNLLFIMQGLMYKAARPSGLNEQELFMITSSPAPSKLADDASIDAAIRGDLNALRQLPDVADAYETNSLSLSGVMQSSRLRTTPDAQGGLFGNLFYADEHALPTLGLKLVAGRNFRSDDIVGHAGSGHIDPSVVLVTGNMAERLFPGESPLGKQVFFAGSTTPGTIVGVVERMQSANSQLDTGNGAWSGVLLPWRAVDSLRYYVVRAKPGRLTAAMQASARALYAQDPQRVIPDGADEEAGIRSFAQIRTQAYRSDNVMAQFLAVISVILLVVTAAGIVGLTSFWVRQRHKQIAIRRALGATRHDILGYFLLENALISAGGVIIGAMLAVGLNIWMVTAFEMSHLPLAYVIAGMAALLLLGQGSVLAPALHASRVQPMEATR